MAFNPWGAFPCPAAPPPPPGFPPPPPGFPPPPGVSPLGVPPGFPPRGGPLTWMGVPPGVQGIPAKFMVATGALCVCVLDIVGTDGGETGEFRRCLRMGASRMTGLLFGLVVLSEDDRALTSGVSGRGGPSEEVCSGRGDHPAAIS